MATRAPDWNKRSAMPRPMRLALPVTRITRPSRGVMLLLCGGHYAAGSPCTSISAGSTPSNAGSGSLPAKLAHPHQNAVDVLKTAATAPMMRGLAWSEAQPATLIETIIVIQVQVSMVEKTRPRNSCPTWRRSCDELDTELTPTAARDKPIQMMPAANEGERLKRRKKRPCKT